MVNIVLVDRLGNFTHHCIDRNRLDNNPENLEKITSIYARPHAHTIVYSKRGYVLVQERTTDKRTASGFSLPIHGGHICEEDKLLAEKRGKLKDIYRIGAVRELKEELGINVKEGELRTLVSKYFKKDELKTLGYNTFMKIFYMIYDRDKHGPKVFNKREIRDLDFMTVEDIEKAGLFQLLGDKMGPYLLNHAKQTSFKIRSLGHEYVLREMRGEIPVAQVPEDVLDLTRLEISPDTLREMLNPEKHK